MDRAAIPPRKQGRRMHEVTRILCAIEQGDPHATERLLPLIYGELRRLAAEKIAHEGPGQTLQATALVHEAYLRLVDAKKVRRWRSRGHFFAAAAEAMRRILVERARRKQSRKGGGTLRRVEIDDVEATTESPKLDLLALDEALSRSATLHPRKAELIKLRFFAGLTNRQAALALGISVSTAKEDWVYAKTWLRVEMGGRGHGSPPS